MYFTKQDADEIYSSIDTNCFPIITIFVGDRPPSSIKRRKEESTDDTDSIALPQQQQQQQKQQGQTLEQQRSQSTIGVTLLTAYGPAFMKVGQAFSITRTDLLPNEKAYYVIGLSTVQDSVSPSLLLLQKPEIHY